MEKKRKFAVITGAGGTLCSCIAKHLAGQGVAVALIGRGYDKLKTVGDEIDKLGGEYVIKCADVTDKERIREIAAELYSELGACDYLINGAGGEPDDGYDDSYRVRPRGAVRTASRGYARIF